MARIALDEIDPKGQSVNMERLIKGFGMDCVTRVIFSVDTGSTKNPENEVRVTLLRSKTVSMLFYGRHLCSISINQ